MDILVYISDLTVFRQWVEDNYGSYPHIATDGSNFWLKDSDVPKIPVRYNGNTSVCLVRMDDTSLIELTPATVLSTGTCGSWCDHTHEDCPYFKLTQAQIDLVEAVLNRQEIDIFDEEGVKIGTYIEPFEFGVIA